MYNILYCINIFSRNIL